jgi:hypothetical protein
MAEEYGVVAVRYNAGNTHIDRLQAKLIADEKLATTAKEFSRAEAVAAIKKGTTFFTIVWGDDKKPRRGAQVKVFPVETDYLKTKQDNSTKDNLEHLPRF